MHLYAIVRGRRSLVRRVLENLEDLFLPWYKDKDGKDIYIQLIPRKVELIEFVFPKEYLNEVVKTLGNAPPKFPNILAKALQLKPIPKISDDTKTFLCRDGDKIGHEFVHFHPIGIKEDKLNDDGIELL